MLPSFRYVRPTSIEGAVRELAAPGARLHAGGTDLLGCLRDRVFEARTVVSLGGVSGLDGIAATPDGGLRIGALCTLAEIAASPLIGARYAALSQAALSAASPQLRNQGTIGGNLCQRPRCWYFRGDFHCLRKGGDRCFAHAGENQLHAVLGGRGCYIVHPSDTAPALTALGARVRVQGPAGARFVAMDDFFVLPEQDPTRETVLEAEEIVTEVLLPPAPAGLRSSYHKVRARGAWDFALAGVALALTMKEGLVQGAGIVLSGVAPVPWRAKSAERAVSGRRIDRRTAERAAAAAIEGAEPLSGNRYKVDLARGAVEKAILAMA